MKSKTPLFIIALFLTLTLSISKGFAQAGIPKGKAHLVEFTNETAKFKVPEGKTWYIYNVFCERKYNKGAEVESTRILISSINNIKFKNGPSIFNQNVGQNLNAPLIFPEKTTFELEISDPSGSKAVINYIEVDN
jgi:hypothetical protein